MPTILTLELRQNRDGRTARDEIDLDRLTPRGRALAEAVARRPLQAKGAIRMLTDQRDPLRPGEREAVMWSGWGVYLVESAMDPHDYLDREGAKIPIGWTVVAGRFEGPLETGQDAQDAEWGVKQCAEAWGVQPGTWRSYVARGQAPRPRRRVGREPLWDAQEVQSYPRPGQGARSDRA